MDVMLSCKGQKLEAYVEQDDKQSSESSPL